MQEHASLAVLFERQMHLRYGYVKLDKNSLSLSTNSKASLEKRVLQKRRKEKKNSLNIWIIIQLTSSTLCLPGKRTYQFGGNWPSFSSLAPYNRRRRKMELGYKHIYDMSSKTEHWKVSDFMKKKTKHEHLQSSKTQTKERDR